MAFAPSERLFGRSETFGGQDPNRDSAIVIEQLRTGQVPGPYLQPLTDLPGRALARLVGPVAAYNLLVLATFPLAAATAYLLARYVLGSHPGAMVAGLVYAVLPFHVAHATGHPHVAQTQWLPLYFLALWRCLDGPDLRRALFLLASAAAVALSNFYAGFIAAVLTPVALVAYAVISPRRPVEERRRRLALTGLTLAVAVAAGFLLTYRVAPAVLLHPGAFAFPRSDLFLYSAKWWSYLVPAVDHPLAGSRIRQFWVERGLEQAFLEQQVGLGWSLLALGSVPLWLWLRGDRTSRASRCAPVLASVAVAALLCSLSPERRIGSFTFVRPSALLYMVAPMFRAYARFGLVVGLMTALMAGGGAAALWRRPTSTGRRAVAVLLGLAALEFAPFPPWRWRDVLPTQAHRWLAGQPGPLRVLDCVPPVRASDLFAVGLFPHELSLLGASFDDCGEPQLADKLAARGYTHVVVRRDSAAESWMAGRPAPAGLAPGPEFGDARVLVVSAERPRTYVAGLGAFYPREYLAEASWRWMGQTGALTLVNASGEPAAVVLELELLAFPGERRVDWLFDGRRRGELELAAEWRRYVVPLGPVAPGEHTLTLECHAPAVVANDIRRNGDPRALCLALGSWSSTPGSRRGP